ncbi:MAG: MFS transporter [Thiotrichales bacterium]|nr:MFS transporter [Thiotrichales bacterium]
MQNAHQPDLIPMSQKIVFGLGMLGNQMFPAALGVFMVILVQSLGMHPVLWGLLFFIPRLVDALTDPIMGFISDNTKSRWGRRRPYVFIGALIAGISFITMWQIYPENGQIYNFWYFLALSLVFYLGMTIFSTPYVAMGYEMSTDYHERTRLMAVSQWIGQWAWVIVPWFWILIYDPTLFDGAAEGARQLAFWVGIGCLLLCLMPAIFAKTQPTPEHTEEISFKKIKHNSTQLLDGLKEVLKHKDFRRICIATFLIFNAFNTVAGFSFFIIVHYMNGGDVVAAGTWPAWFGSLSALATCFLVIPIVTYLSQRFGKRNTFLIAQSISLLGYALFLWAFQPDNPYLMFLPLPLFAFGIGSLFMLMMSMTGDICDLDEQKYGTRREATFGAVYWWMVKVGFAVAGMLSGFILWFIGFDQTLSQQSQSTLDSLLLAYVLVPVIGTLIAMWVMRGYGLNEERVHEIREELDLRHAHA